MSIKEQAIKIEQLKQERDESRNALQSEKLSISRQIDCITREMFDLGRKRAKLDEQLEELRAREKRDAEHYDLVIRARQALNANRLTSEDEKK